MFISVFPPGGPRGDRLFQLFTPSYHQICLELLCHAGHTGPSGGGEERFVIRRRLLMGCLARAQRCMRMCYSGKVHAQTLALRVICTENKSSVSENAGVHAGNVHAAVTSRCWMPSSSGVQHPGSHDRGNETSATPSGPRMYSALYCVSDWKDSGF